MSLLPNYYMEARLEAVIKDVRGWQFLTVEAAETLCMVCVPTEEHIFRKKYLGNQAFKKSNFIRV